MILLAAHQMQGKLFFYVIVIEQLVYILGLWLRRDCLFQKFESEFILAQRSMTD